LKTAATQALEPWLDGALAKCRATWPTLSARDFRRTLSIRAAPMTDTQREALHVTDLYLAVACAHEDPAALALFEAEIVPRVQKTLTRLLPAGWQTADAAQALRTRLFVPGPTGRGIDSYSGRGALTGWVRTVATRLLLDARRKHQETAPLTDSLEDRLRTSGLSAELQAMRAELVPVVRAAIKAALESLTAKERTLLKLHYVDGLSFEQIAKLNRVHRSTVMRWLQGIREECLDHVKETLSRSLSLPPRQIESLLAVARSHLEMSLSPLLRGETAP
jgi:RNA polymerase sigma-70 factor (ECF subfamily)